MRNIVNGLLVREDLSPCSPAEALTGAHILICGAFPAGTLSQTKH